MGRKTLIAKVGKRDMNTQLQSEYSKLNDQGLLDLFEKHRDRNAVRELYERYRGPIGRFLYREIKDKTTVADAFNTVILRLVSQGSKPTPECSAAIRIFAMAYTLRREYANGCDSLSGSEKSMDKEAEGDPLSQLSRQQQDVLELIYQHNFSFDQAADIMDCSLLMVKSYWSDVKRQYLSSPKTLSALF